MDNTNFEGISVFFRLLKVYVFSYSFFNKKGPVWFTGDGDRITKILIEQLQSI
jgi:hypothetical protein